MGLGSTTLLILYAWYTPESRLSYVMWNLFTVGSLQFCMDSTIASLEANQNRPI